MVTSEELNMREENHLVPAQRLLLATSSCIEEAIEQDGLRVNRRMLIVKGPLIHERFSATVSKRLTRSV